MKKAYLKRLYLTFFQIPIKIIKQKLINNIYLYKIEFAAYVARITSSFNSSSATIKIGDGLLLIDISKLEISKKLYLINSNSIKNRIFDFKIKLSNIDSYIKS